EDDDVGRVLADLGEGGGAVLRLGDAIALRRQAGAQQAADRRLVVDDEDGDRVGGHSPLLWRTGSRAAASMSSRSRMLRTYWRLASRCGWKSQAWGRPRRKAAATRWRRRWLARTASVRRGRSQREATS